MEEVAVTSLEPTMMKLVRSLPEAVDTKRVPKTCVGPNLDDDDLKIGRFLLLSRIFKHICKKKSDCKFGKDSGNLGLVKGSCIQFK